LSISRNRVNSTITRGRGGWDRGARGY